MTSANPFDLLRLEHERIGRVLDAFELLLEECQNGRVHQDELESFVSFFSQYADFGHHEKEEDILIPMLVDSGFDWNRGALKAMRGEHRQERSLMAGLRNAAKQSARLSKDDVRWCVSLGSEFIEFQREHMRKENEFFAEVEPKIATEKMANAASAMQRFDEEREDGGEARRLDRLARELLSVGDQRRNSERPTERKAEFAEGGQ